MAGDHSRPVSPALAVVVMAGGLGTRMKSAAKHLHPLLGRRIVDWVLAAARAARRGAARGRHVGRTPRTHYDSDGRPWRCSTMRGVPATRLPRLRAALEGFEGDVLVLSARRAARDARLLDEFVAHHRAGTAAVTILTIEPVVPLAYGRIVRGDDGSVLEIVEERDATDEQRAIRELNSSIYVFEATALARRSRARARNAQGELYLTDASPDPRARAAGGGPAAATDGRSRSASTTGRARGCRRRACATASTRRTCSPA